MKIYWLVLFHLKKCKSSCDLAWGSANDFSLFHHTLKVHFFLFYYFTARYLVVIGLIVVSGYRHCISCHRILYVRILSLDNLSTQDIFSLDTGILSLIILSSQDILSLDILSSQDIFLLNILLLNILSLDSFASQDILSLDIFSQDILSLANFLSSQDILSVDILSSL
jgi:hypothetical protein